MHKQLIALGVVVGICAAADPNPRQAFQTKSTAARFWIELNRDGKAERVSARHRFQARDRFRIIFELSRESYVYLINRSIEGDPANLGSSLGTRDLYVTNTGATAQTSAAPQLIWPPAGGDARLNAVESKSVPGPTQFFEFDQKPGIEKLTLIISPYPIDPRLYVPRLQPPPAAAAPQNSKQSSSKQGTPARTDDLRSIEANTALDAKSLRDICVDDCAHYAAPLNPAKPFVFTADLQHYR